MLQAILNGKIRGLFDNINDGMSWRKAYSTYEDFLTASVIGRMIYLPEGVLWNLIKRSSLHSLVPEHVGCINQVDFWPKWPVPPWLDRDSQYREPDVFIRFEKIDIIVEAKRNDATAQNIVQWVEQILSFLFKRDTEGERKHPIIYWVLGGMGDTFSQEFVDLERNKLIKLINQKYPQEKIGLAVSSWSNLLSCLLDLQHFLSEEINRPSNLISANGRQHVLRITSDIIEALRIHGIKEWHFLTETIAYWSEKNFSVQSFDYFDTVDIVSYKKNLKKSLFWGKLHNTENNFDDAIRWYGG